MAFPGLRHALVAVALCRVVEGCECWGWWTCTCSWNFCLTTTRLYKDGVLASYIDDGFEPSVLTRSKHVLGKAYGSNHFQGHILCGNQPVCRVAGSVER